MAVRHESLSKNIRRRKVSSSGIYDVINVILGVLIILVGILLFISREKFQQMFAVEFILAMGMNICLGIKRLARREVLKSVALFIAAAFFLLMTVISIAALL